MLTFSRSKSFSTEARRGFTLIELLVVIAIIALLAAILFPVFARARENARKSSCSNNVKQLGIGFLQYKQDYDEKWAGGWGGTTGTTAVSTWTYSLQPYVKSNQIFKCPSDSFTDVYTSYVVNNIGLHNCDTNGTGGGLNTVSDADIAKPAELLVIADGRVGAAGQTGDYSLWHSWGRVANNAGARLPRHLGATNILFADGHVKAYNSNINATGTPGGAFLFKFVNPNACTGGGANGVNWG